MISDLSKNYASSLNDLAPREWLNLGLLIRMHRGEDGFTGRWLQRSDPPRGIMFEELRSRPENESIKGQKLTPLLTRLQAMGLVALAQSKPTCCLPTVLGGAVFDGLNGIPTAIEKIKEGWSSKLF